MWPTVGWTEITSTYAGLFFRAAGGDAAAFGSTQAESFPRLTSVRRSTLTTFETSVAVELNAWSPTISTGPLLPATGLHTGLRFLVSPLGEVRPRNQAVRIWRRA